MIPPSRAIWVALTMLAATGAVRAAFNFPQLEGASEEEAAQYLKTEGDRSLHEKLQVGKERYEERRTFRQELVNAMRTNCEVRRAAIVGQLAVTPVVSHKLSGPLTSFACVGGLALAAVCFVHYLRRRRTDA